MGFAGMATKRRGWPSICRNDGIERTHSNLLGWAGGRRIRRNAADRCRRAGGSRSFHTSRHRCSRSRNCPARQIGHAAARKHRLFDMRARTWPRAWAFAYPGFPRHHVLLRLRRRYRRILSEVSRPDSDEKRYRESRWGFRCRCNEGSSDL